MIQIYNPTNTDYTHNGDQTLIPSAATVHVILNGSWTAELTHPIDADGRWKYIVEDAVVKMPSFNGDQLFRIKATSKSDSGAIASMEPIFMDSMGDCFLVDIRPTAKNGQQALDDMVSPNGKYSASSNITRVNTAYYQYKNLIEAIAGDDDNAFLRRWGGEVLYDNYQVIINERVGGDYGVEVRYGKNIPQNGVTEEVDTSAVITRIYPKAYNGYTMTDNGYVDSPLINSYPTIKATTLTFEDVKMAEDAQEDDAENGIIICNSQEELDQALTQKCQDQYDAGLDKPIVSLSIQMVLLQNTDQYKDYQVMETVSLGDTIHCRDSHLDITSDARVIELEYNSITKRVSSVEIGEFQYDYFEQVTDATTRIDQVTRPDGTLMAEKVQGLLNGIYTQLFLQSTAAQKVNGTAFRTEDLDPDSALFGAMEWGTQGIQISAKRTADGRGWEWTTAMTAKGIVADTIITGTISDKTGKSYWNLDTGELVVGDESSRINAGILQSPNFVSKQTGVQIDLNTGVVQGEIEATNLSAKEAIKIYYQDEEHEIVNGYYSEDFIAAIFGCDLENYPPTQRATPSININKSGTASLILITASDIELDGPVGVNGALSVAGDITTFGKVIASGNITTDKDFVGHSLGLYGTETHINFHTDNPSGVQDYGRVSSDLGGRIQIGGTGEYGDVFVDSTSGYLAPDTTGKYSLGSQYLRFYKLWVANGVDNSSLAELKTDIKPFRSALEELDKTDVYNYKLKSAIERNGDDIVRTGFVIGEGYRVSEYLLGESREGIDLYSAIGIAFGALKEMLEIIRKQDKKIKELEAVILGKERNHD